MLGGCGNNDGNCFSQWLETNREVFVVNIEVMATSLNLKNLKEENYEPS